MKKETPLDKAKKIYLQKDKHAQALAYLLFREIVEDVHSEYNISDKEMMEMCKKAVNRASMYLDIVQDEDRLTTLVGLLSLYTGEWDKPIATEDTKSLTKVIDEQLAMARKLYKEE